MKTLKVLVEAGTHLGIAGCCGQKIIEYPDVPDKIKAIRMIVKKEHKRFFRKEKNVREGSYIWRDNIIFTWIRPNNTTIIEFRIIRKVKE